MRCPYCNQENEAGSVYCANCGKKIVGANSPNSADSFWNDDTTFGYKPSDPLPDPQTVYYPPNPPRKNNTALYVVLGLCILAVVILGVIVGMKIINPDPEDDATTEATTEASEEGTTEASEEATTEETTTEESTATLSGVDPSNEADFNNNLSPDDYIQMTASDSTLSFAYPKDFFSSCEITDDGNRYNFYSSDGSVTLSYWKEEVSGSGVSVLQNTFYSKESELYTSSKSDDGVERYSAIAKDWTSEDIPHYVLGGPYLSDTSRGYYSVASYQNGAVYYMEIEYPIDNEHNFYNPTNYMLDCLYRYCKFRGAKTYRKCRTYEEFCNDEG